MTSNLEIIEQNIKSIYPNYEIVYIPGHYASLGTDANIMKNPIWKLKNDNLEFLLMYCEKDTLCKLCDISYQK